MVGNTAGEIKYEARIVDSQFRRDGKDVEKEAESIGGKVGRTFERAERGSAILLGSITAVGVAATAMFTKFILMGGFSRALNIEDAEAKLKGLGHSTEAVEGIMDSALASVKGTAYGLDAAATTAATAVAAGIKPGQELTRYLKLTADGATIAGISMSDMGRVFNKVQTVQAAYNDSLLELSEKGIPIYQLLAAEMGITAQEVKKLASEGKVSSEVFLNAIEKNIGGAALESGKTTRGAWANMQAAMARVGATIATSILPKMRDAITSVTVWFDQNADTIVDIAGKVVDAFLQMVQGISNFLSSERNVWILTGAIVGGLLPALGALIATIGLAVLNFLPFLIIGAALAALAFLIKENWDQIIATFHNVKDSITDAIAGVINWFEDLRDTAKGILDSIVGWIEDNETAIRNWAIVIGTVLLPKFMQIAIGAGIAATKATIAAALTGAAWVAAAFRASIAWFIALPKVIASFAAMSYHAIINAAKASGAWVMSALKASAAVGLAALRMAASWLLALGPIGLAITLIAGVAALIIANWETVKEWFKSFANWIKNLVSGIINWFKNNWDIILTILTGPFGLAVLIIRRYGDSILDFFKQLPNRIINALRGAGSWLFNIGKEMINGLINGAGSLLRNIGSFFLDIIPGWIVEPFKKALGIHSPSKVFMELGGDVMAGLSIGLEDTNGMATSAIDTTTDAMVEPVEDMGRHAQTAPSFNISVDMKGIMSRSRSDEREIAKGLVEAINEELRAKNLPQIGGDSLNGFNARRAAA